MPSPNKKVVQSYVTPEEYERLKAYAAQAGISLSMYVKRVGLGEQVRSTADHEAVRALMKANADLGRLGGLFKKALSEGQSRELAFEFRQLLRKIEHSQAQVTACCRTVANPMK